ncbi:MAG: hypothetical protein K0V04_31760 [Deltaproteobacteria bacterium]|nr:hypothetical protein [Deltaproteobacteria bacterium]
MPDVKTICGLSTTFLFALGIAACGGKDDGTGLEPFPTGADGGSVGEDGPGGDGMDGPAEDDDGPADDGPDDGPADDGPDDGPGDDGPVSGCDLDMDIGIRLGVDVSWPGGIAILDGAGAIDIWLLGHLSPNGTDIALSGQVCRLSLPDFDTGVLAGNETYGTEFLDSIWTQPNMPLIDAVATVSSNDPGAEIHLERGGVILGATMADPLDGAWPGSWQGLDTIDHDGDGNPGITAMAKTGGNYAYPRIDILNPNARAQTLWLASRTIMEFMGTVDDCDSASGEAFITMENHNVGCNIVGGGNCSDGQTTTLDNNLPQFSINGGVFDLVRLPDGAVCTDVFAALP